MWKNEKTLERIDEKNEITKFIEVVIINAKLVKYVQSKVVESEQGGECDPRIVAFRKYIK